MKDKKFLRVVEGAIKGNQQSFERLMQMRGRNILYIAKSIMGNKGSGEDVAQEAAALMHRNISTLKNPQAFDSWMYRIVYNACLDELKKTARMKDSTEIDFQVEQHFQEERSEFLPESFINDEESRRQLLAAINQLPEKYRMCILMFYYEDLDYVEIAEVMDLPKQNVANYLYQAKKRLRTQLIGTELDQRAAAAIAADISALRTPEENAFVAASQGSTAGTAAAAASGAAAAATHGTAAPYVAAAPFGTANAVPQVAGTCSPGASNTGSSSVPPAAMVTPYQVPSLTNTTPAQTEAGHVGGVESVAFGGNTHRPAENAPAVTSGTTTPAPQTEIYTVDAQGTPVTTNFTGTKTGIVSKNAGVVAIGAAITQALKADEQLSVSATTLQGFYTSLGSTGIISASAAASAIASNGYLVSPLGSLFDRVRDTGILGVFGIATTAAVMAGGIYVATFGLPEAYLPDVNIPVAEAQSQSDTEQDDTQPAENADPTVSEPSVDTPSDGTAEPTTRTPNTTPSVPSGAVPRDEDLRDVGLDPDDAERLPDFGTGEESSDDWQDYVEKTKLYVCDSTFVSEGGLNVRYSVYVLDDPTSSRLLVTIERSTVAGGVRVAYRMVESLSDVPSGFLIVDTFNAWK